MTERESPLTPELRMAVAAAMRHVTRRLFEGHNLDLSQRSEPWVHIDSYDAGLLAAAKYMLRRADEIEAGL